MPPVPLSSCFAGANEMTYSLGFLRQFMRIFQQQADTTRIFFPDPKVGRAGGLGGWLCVCLRVRACCSAAGWRLMQLIGC